VPIAAIVYDSKRVPEEKLRPLADAVEQIVAEVTKAKDVTIYANSPIIYRCKEAIEIFVLASAHLMANNQKTLWEIQEKVVKWKAASNFDIPVNITLMPMNWVFVEGV
jgi:hypothetical protein